MLNKCGGAAKLSQTALNTHKRSVKFNRNNRFRFSLSARPSGTTSWYINVNQTGNSTGLVAMGVKRCYRRHNKRLCYNTNNAAAADGSNLSRLQTARYVRVYVHFGPPKLPPKVVFSRGCILPASSSSTNFIATQVLQKLQGRR